jgi:hypothetical protein
MKINNTIAEVRKSSSKISKNSIDRIAVIVLIPYSARRADYGIQFWTPELIKTGVSINTDKTKSIFVEIL